MFDLFYFIAFILIVLIVTISIIYSSLRFGISPMPSSRKAYNAVFQLIDAITNDSTFGLKPDLAPNASFPPSFDFTDSGPIIDLGSGWGNLVLRIAKRYPNKEVIGYEMSILPWLTSVLLKKAFGLNNLTLHRQDFYNVKFPAKSVLVCYLFPEAMAKISTKLRGQSEVSFLISNNFALPDFQPCKTIQLNDFYKSPIYLYKLSYLS